MQSEVSWNITSEFLESIFANGRMLKRGYSKIEEEINYFTFTHFLQFYRKQSSSTRKFLNIYTYYNFKIPIFVIRNLDIRLAHRISNNSPNLLINCGHIQKHDPWSDSGHDRGEDRSSHRLALILLEERDAIFRHQNFFSSFLVEWKERAQHPSTVKIQCAKEGT